ncbi:MAG: hypothetical protein JXA69_20870 [Phycisphaerae bacterium]|nr:hypothetical protein [Phycisphaerae bacterium]
MRRTIALSVVLWALIAPSVPATEPTLLSPTDASVAGLSDEQIFGIDRHGVPLASGTVTMPDASPSLPFMMSTDDSPVETRGWECVPGVIRDDGVEIFRLEVRLTTPVQAVTLTGVSGALIAPDSTPLELRDDGQGEDVTANDGVFTTGPFRYNTAAPLPTYYLNDPSSPAGVNIIAVGQVAIEETSGATTRFLIHPSVGIVDSALPAPSINTLSDDVQISQNLINVRTATRATQAYLRGTGGNLSGLTTTIYARLPDVIDMFLFFSTYKIERVPYAEPENFFAGSHTSVQVNFTGTGQPMFDNSAAYGSAGTLSGMNVLDAYDRGALSVTAVHEMLHQWAAYLNSAIGLTDGTGHFLARSSVGSLVGGQQWLDNGDGTFTLNCEEGRNAAHAASPLDRYLMGLIEGNDVPTLHVYDPTSPPPLLRCGEIIDDIVRTVTVKYIQEFHGPRWPGPATAKRDFRLAFVAESHNRWLTTTEMTYYDTLARHFAAAVPPESPDPYVSINWAPITRFFGEGTSWRTEIIRYHDTDQDGDVDLSDFEVFQTCFNGPNRPPRATNCDRVDEDQDGDVDQTDFAGFLACFNGPNRPPKCAP